MVLSGRGRVYVSRFHRRGCFRACFCFRRYDYENVASEGAEAMMDYLRAGPANPGEDMGSGFELKCG